MNQHEKFETMMNLENKIELAKHEIRTIEALPEVEDRSWNEIMKLRRQRIFDLKRNIKLMDFKFFQLEAA